MMVRLEAEIANHILKTCPARHDRALQDCFGISYNTFRKIEAGEPIRQTVALRLMDRISGEL